eukprot:TRINITY_DN3070_c0_g1_i1.p1 TRINITY_DN3070_c0_g1~~TRINITY_DN3070_c0_g1_i1.p1  ORF type:complete len:398 (+),score=117.56 TRINITY_DN3070_c0_g1_i1:61-1254(+)
MDGDGRSPMNTPRGPRTFEEMNADYQRLKKKYHQVDEWEKKTRAENGGEVPERYQERLRGKKRLFRDIKAMKKRLEDYKAGGSGNSPPSGKPLEAPSGNVSGGRRVPPVHIDAIAIGRAGGATAAGASPSLTPSASPITESTPLPSPVDAAPAAAAEADSPTRRRANASPPSPQAPPPPVEPGAVVEVVGLTVDFALNGHVGSVLRLHPLSDGSPGAVVEFSTASGLPARLLRVANLSTVVRPREGLTVQVCGLEREVTLNGQQGQVVREESMSDGAAGAVVALPPPIGQCKLPVTNLAVVVPIEDEGGDDEDTGSASHQPEQASLPDDRGLDSPRPREPERAPTQHDEGFQTLDTASAEIKQLCKGKSDRGAKVLHWLDAVVPSDADPFAGMAAVA